MEKDKILVTGACGFIGYHLTKRLVDMGHRVFGLDNLNDYYDVNLKKARLRNLECYDNFEFLQMDLSHLSVVEQLSGLDFESIYNLAAQPGVRYSIENPSVYIASNLVGFANILEVSRRKAVKHLLFASTSSVYGSNQQIPYSTKHTTDHPLTIYAATKKSNEMMAHAYSHLFHIPVTGLRFFTVYGPYGRPDMAPFKFTKAILESKPIQVYNHGAMKRDFTYVDDIVESLVRLLNKIPEPSPNWDPMNPVPDISSAPYRLLNIGNSNPIGLMKFIETLEKALGKTALKEFLPLQPGEVLETHADVAELENLVDFRPATPIEVGVGRFVDWYLSYYK